MPVKLEYKRATWRIGATPMFRSVEQADGILGVDYSEGVDTRWPNPTLGPAMNTLDFSGVGGSAANVNGIEVYETTGPYIYFNRGTRPAKVKASDMSVQTDAMTVFTEDSTSILRTKLPVAPSTEEISFGFPTIAYRTLTTVGVPPAADVSAANSAAQVLRVLGLAPDRTAGFLGPSAYGNILSAAVTMAAPSWIKLSTYNGGAITPTGFAMNRNLWVWCTDRGALMLNAQQGRFQTVQGLLSSPDTENGRAVKEIPYLGTIIPGSRTTRRQDLYDGRRVGPEAFANNQSMIQGRFVSMDFDEDWVIGGYQSNTSPTTYYLLAFRPRQPGDLHDQPISYYCIYSSNGVMNAIKWLSKLGGRTLDTWVVGSGSNAQWFSGGRSSNWSTDTQYTFFTGSKSVYLTEMRRDPHIQKSVAGLEFVALNCSATQTLQFYIAADGNIPGGAYTQVGGTITKPGLVRIFVRDGQRIQGRAFKIKVTFTGAGSGSPSILDGVVRLVYREMSAAKDIDGHFGFEGENP